MPDFMIENTKSNAETINGQTLISQIEPIRENRDVLIRNVDMLKDLVEAPLLIPCQDLFSKGIRTLSSSANRNDFDNLENGFAYLNIDWDSMSLENREIALRNATKVTKPEEEPIYLFGTEVKERTILINPGRPKYKDPGTITIAIPLSKNTTVHDVEIGVKEITDKFIQQPAIWVEAYTLDQLKKGYGISDPKVTSETFIEAGFYYDPISETFYLSKELFELRQIKNPTEAPRLARD